jgi:hypothetical protein
MKRIRLRTKVAVVLNLAFVGHAAATAMYDYKPGQFLVIEHGTSPDKKFSIVAGENKAGEFGVYLRDAQTKKLIGQLEEVATELDSAADAFHAHWAPDSKHVGVFSRADRHLTRNVIYRIENRRAYVVETPELMCHAAPDFCALQKELGGALALIVTTTTTSPGKCGRTKAIPKSRNGFRPRISWLAKNPSGRSGNAIHRRHSVSTERRKNHRTRAMNRPLSIMFGLMPKASASCCLTTKVTS